MSFVLCPILVLLSCLSCHVALHLHISIKFCFSVCVYVCVYMCVSECVCENEKKVPEKRQTTLASHNERNITEQGEARFVSRVTVILTREKERCKNCSLLNLHLSQSTCFGI